MAGTLCLPRFYVYHCHCGAAQGSGLSETLRTMEEGIAPVMERRYGLNPAAGAFR